MDAMERTFQLHVPSSTENLSMIRDFVGSIGERAGFGKRDLMQLELAVDEACANVIEHAYGSDTTHEVTVKATLDADAVEIRIIDTGRGFDPSLVKPEDTESLIAQGKSGGLGMRIISRVMDEVKYEIGPGQKNELRMIKRLRKPDQA
jgi:serine/threonine-protein kinase RsbW